MRPRSSRPKPGVAALAVAWLLSFALPLFVPTPAHAHIDLQYPPTRCAQQKAGPCGEGCDTRSTQVTHLRPGATITVVLDEFIPHPSHFRISFDADGHDDFVTPTDPDERYSNETVLLDGITDVDGQKFHGIPVTLPDIECDNCTLQVIQFMYDKLNNGRDDEIYFQCADLVLSADAPGPPGTGADAGPGPGIDAGNPLNDSGGGDGGGCNGSGASLGSLGSVLLVVAGLILLIRRRRSARAYWRRERDGKR